MDGARDVEPLEDVSRARLHAVAIVREHDVLEIPVALDIEGLRIARGGSEHLFLFAHRLPEHGEPHHHHVQDRDVIVGEVIL